ncbi:Tripartite tricarboxylate transporter TctB family protein [Pseudooceanicola antarcticus]|uniref:Tripartite tricarboxylate transporter TctB family protein n=1 Tax=Pseudooceanicola antarcticus TaxID=1247613 RepID=A0A285J5G3_9RHOB|nr:tripartite tricarboxylate transporter TctB family protein [Pseudooceanicola antarcticus]PJE26865.1 tripartite tricarboxylate transporter TctB family protein [Pseudooceanicola antarcticus]SNY55580.1 Tripartite tricarboxylate transporter TctB family protein [Pseudooceanicola antarcticus]
MPESRKSRLTRPETLTALGILLVAAGFLIPTSELRPISALLPAAMLIGLIVLAVLLLLADQRKAAAGEEAKPVTQSPKRVVGAFLLIVSYALATDFIGFYVSTAVTIPLVAWLFGYRNPLGLLVATVIVVGTIWAIFDFGMSQDFPTGRFWGR